jgi:hypothetical protein
MVQPETKPEIVREDIIRQLEKFPFEVLEAALMVLQHRRSEIEKRSATSC